MIPKKVYISIAVWDKGRKYDFLEVSERPHQTTDTQCHWREYTDLSQVWHDASEEPLLEEKEIIFLNEQGVAYISERFGGTFSYMLEESSWERYINLLRIDKWTYISDLLPKQFGNSERLKGDEND